MAGAFRRSGVQSGTRLIADEIGCAQRTVADRQRRLGVEPAINRGRPRKVELAEPANSANGSTGDAEAVAPFAAK